MPQARQKINNKSLRCVGVKVKSKLNQSYRKSLNYFAKPVINTDTNKRDLIMFLKCDVIDMFVKGKAAYVKEWY